MNRDLKANYDALKNKSDSQAENDNDPVRYKTAGYSRNVCFVQRDGKETFLNYAYLVSAELVEDEILLIFTTHRITLKGNGMKELFHEFMDQIPRMLMHQDERYESLNEPDDKCVREIIIESN